VFKDLDMRSKISNKVWQFVAYLVVFIGIGVGAYFSRDNWLPLLIKETPEVATEEEYPVVEEPKVLKLSKEARANLALVSKPAKPQSYWKKLQIPGVIVDRPGITDRGITAPIEGVVTQVHAFEGDIIRPGEKLFSLRLVSESLQQTQSELFKAIRETEIVDRERSRIGNLVDSGVIPGKRIIELDQQKNRQAALIDAHRQDLISRGISQTQLEAIESGEFLTTINIFAPDIFEPNSEVVQVGFTKNMGLLESGFYEIQDLKVELGQQVESGQALAVLANHNSLYIKGHAFKKEASNLARAAENNWPVGVEFTEDVAKDWSKLTQEFQIRHLANTTDPSSRTFDFFVPLTNQSRSYKKDDRTFVIWRFRPGQRVSIDVPVEQIENVIVLPSAAVVHEGPEAYVFQQNGDLFNRISVQVIHQDRTKVVIANDGTITPGFYLAQNSAASLNRVLKAQAASGMRADVHVHADGTVHAH
jgi:multidrug efflux pump subunit AcrA (membrane-fusion protein)